MKKIVVLPLLISSLVISSILSAVPVRAAAVAPSQCNPNANPPQTFACLGEAVNADVLGDAYRTTENVARSAGGDALTALMVGLNVMVSGSSKLYPQSAFNWPQNPYIEGGGALGTLARAVDSVYTNPPNHLVNKNEFFREALANNILNPQPAYAQGYGTDLLKSLTFLSLWKLFRNISYLALAAVLAIFGLMVMFRAKADPRTTVTFQMALPRVAVALVLIYFSLPIAGVLMDSGEVASTVIKGMFCPGCTINHVTVLANFGQIWKDFSFLGNLDIHIDDKIDPFIKILLSIFALTVVLKLFWTLISRYVTLVLQAILGPVHFVMGVLPGRDDAAGRWVKEMLVNVLTFPGILFLINIAYVIKDSAAATSLPTILVQPGATDPAKAVNLSGLMALGILSLAPKIPALLEEMFDVVPGAHSSRAGADPGSMLKGVPVVGKMMG